MQLEPINVLLAEDNEDDILLIKLALEDARLINLMHVVRDGEEAMTYLKQEGQYSNSPIPGLVLLDVNMPRKNGFEVLDEIKADPKLRHIPVAMLTVSERDEDVTRSYSHGACSFVRKPVDFQEFQRVIKQFSLYWALVATVPSVSR